MKPVNPTITRDRDGHAFTLRDLFAACSLMGQLAGGEEDITEEVARVRVICAYADADMMLEVRGAKR